MAQAHRLIVAGGIVLAGVLGVVAAQQVAPAGGQPGPRSGIGSAPVTAVAPPAPGRMTGLAPGTPQLHNRYTTLLKKIDVPADQTTYGDFYDFGFWAETSYAGQNNLPQGYWVYLAPSWYIFQDGCQTPGDLKSQPCAWGPEQATGAPDTWPNVGDLGTAWASKTPDGQEEWLELTYDAPTRPVAVTIYETFNPGAVERVTAYNAEGKEFNLWSGTDPTPVGQEKGISVIPVHPEMDITRIRVYVESQKVPGWNEIDAVGLLDASGTTHWAKSATASSSYADVGGEIENLPADLGDIRYRTRTLEEQSAAPIDPRTGGAPVNK